jgi:hypothetical protein
MSTGVVRRSVFEMRGEPNMADLFVVVTVLAFFALCVAFVYGCDRIIGPDEAFDLDEFSETEEPVAEVIR